MKTTIIIGASSGVGKALANKLISKGENVIAISRSQPDSNFTSFIPFDILSDNELPKIDGVIDGLVYCPGSINLKPFRSLKKQDFINELEINVFGAIKSIQAYLPNLQLSTQASIVMYSTVAVQMGMPFHTSISVAKGAVEGLTNRWQPSLLPK